jgi:hypothetical protein
MDMVLLDWTRMGNAFCLAGVVHEKGTWRVVRPLLAKGRELPARTVGWAPRNVYGRARWEAFELIGPEPAVGEPPHLEDVWVRALRPRNGVAGPGERREILTATAAQAGEVPFGAPLIRTRAAAYLRPGMGRQSLATLEVSAVRITFSASQRQGTLLPDVRVSLPVPGVGERLLPVKDHPLLHRAEWATTGLDQQVAWLNQAVRQMGERVAVRLGLSRPFAPREDGGAGFCWLMADGFFSLVDPQP